MRMPMTTRIGAPGIAWRAGSVVCRVRRLAAGCKPRMGVSPDAARAAGAAPSNQQERSTGRPPDTGPADATPIYGMKACAGPGHAARRSDAAPTLCHPARDDDRSGNADRASTRRRGAAAAAAPLGLWRPGRGVLPGAGLVVLDFLNIH